MKKSLLSVAGCILALVVTNVASAVPITGNIDFAGAAVLDSMNLATATQVTSWLPNPIATDGTGTFAAVVYGTPAFFSAPYVFTAGKAALWTVTIGTTTYTFNLTSSSIMTQNATVLAVIGTGNITSSNPLETTASASWSFSTQNASGGSQNSIFSFSATSGVVPDGGTTALLLGAGLVGVGLMARRRQLLA